MVTKLDNDLEMASIEENKSTETPSSEIKIGQIYSVKRIDGEWCPAEVLETRILKSQRVEYFVHFENSN